MEKKIEVLEFKNNSEALTIGAEIELQLLDASSLDLKASSLEVLKRVGETNKVHAELFQSMLEINSGVCKDIHELNADLEQSIEKVMGVAKELNLRVASAGTHPFALYNERKLFPEERYRYLIDRNQWIARRLMIFGLHFHIGMRDGDHAIQMNNALLHYLPILLALSASSPFWHGEDTELASSRITFFEALPTGGHPCLVKDWAEFSDLYNLLKKTQAVTSMKDIWWDIRPSPGYGTIEIRICDSLPTLKETMAVGALLHLLCHFIDRQLKAGRIFSAPPYWMLRENKWRASRHGIEAKIILNEKGETIHSRDLVNNLIELLNNEFPQFKYSEYFAVLKKNLERGFSYSRQRKVFASSSEKGFKEVASHIATEFETNEPQWI